MNVGAGTEEPLTLHRTIVDSDSEDSSKSDSEAHPCDDVEEDEDDLLKEDNEEEEVKEDEGEAEGEDLFFCIIIATIAIFIDSSLP